MRAAKITIQFFKIESNGGNLDMPEQVEVKQFIIDILPP